MPVPAPRLTANPISRYRSAVRMKGINAVFSIVLIFVKISVLVSSQIRFAPDDIGEQRSPKKMPERIAPPVYITGMRILLAKVMQITPIVAALPKAVPIRNDTTQHSTNVISTIACGTANIEA